MLGRNRLGTTRLGSSGVVGIISKAISAGLALSASAGRSIGKGVTSTLVLSGTIGRTIAKAVLGGIALTGSVARTKIFYKAITAGEKSIANLRARMALFEEIMGIEE